jgi:hypothetical protein
MIALLAALSGVLRLLTGRLVALVALLATLVLIGTCHDKTPLVIINGMTTDRHGNAFRVPLLLSFLFRGLLI